MNLIEMRRVVKVGLERLVKRTLLVSRDERRILRAQITLFDSPEAQAYWEMIYNSLPTEDES